MQLDSSHSSSEGYIQLYSEDSASEEEKKTPLPKKSLKGVPNQVAHIQKQAFASINHSNGHSYSSPPGQQTLPPTLKLDSLVSQQLSENDRTNSTYSPRPFALPLKEIPSPPARKVSKRLNSSKTNRTHCEASPSSSAPQPHSIPSSQPSSARIRSTRSFSISQRDYPSSLSPRKENAKSSKKRFLQQSKDVLDAFETLYQTISDWRGKELVLNPENPLIEKSRVEKVFTQTFKVQCQEQWLTVVDKISIFLDEQNLSPPLSSRSSGELTSRPRSVSLPTFVEYLQDPISISLQDSFKQDGISLSKQSAIRSAIQPLLSACLIDFSKPLTDKSTMKQILKLLDLSKSDPDFVIFIKYRQTLVELADLLSHPSPDVPPHIPKVQQHLISSFLSSLRQSKEVKMASEGKANRITEYCQESVQLLHIGIEALDKAIQTHFSTFVESMHGQQTQLCQQTYEILLKNQDRHFEANAIRALEGGYLHLIKKKKKTLLAPSYLRENEDPANIQKQHALALKKSLKSLLRFLTRRLVPDVDLKTDFQQWFTLPSSSKPLTKESMMKAFAAQYAALYQEWNKKLVSEMEPEAIDLLLNQFPMYKIGIVLGLFNQEFLKGITGKIIELHKHLTKNNFSCPIKSSALDDHLSKKIRIEFKDHTLFFMAKRVGDLELDPHCRLTTISRFHAPIHALAHLNISYELVVDLPDHPLAPEAAQQLEEILMIAQMMGLIIKIPSKEAMLPS